MERSRPQEPGATVADEQELLDAWLAFHRGALEAKCSGLTAEQLVTRSVAPSDLSLLGLVRHMTEMERVYLAQPLSGEETQLLYCTDDSPDGDFEDVDPDRAEEDLARWRAACARSDAALAAHPSLTAAAPGRSANARWLLLKVIGEYARHNGHADLIRQSIDGAVGE